MAKKLTKCKACGAEIAKSAKTCPQCGAKQHQVVGAICAAIIVITIFACIGILASSGDDEPKLVNPTPNTSASVALTEQPLVFGVGETAELKDIQVTLTSVEENNGTQFSKPASGNIFLLCEFTIENNSNSDLAISSLMCFETYVDDFSTNMSITATVLSDKGQLDGTVAAGKKMNGVIGYEVPTDYKNIEVRFTPDFWNGTDITFVYEK